MFRKFVLAIAAVAALGTVSLAPTSADAGWKFKHWHGYHHYGHGFGFYAPVRHYGCFKWVRTYYGWQKINVCHYY